MARSALICALLAAVLFAAQATDLRVPHRHLLQPASASSTAGASSDDPEGNAAASVNVKSTGGTAVGEAFADTQINEQSVETIKSIWGRAREKIPDGATCDDVILGIDAEVMESVMAIAEVYASAFGTVTIMGTGEGCTDASASGDATATAYLQVVVDVAVELVYEGDEAKANDAFARAYADLVTAGVAEAWAEAYISGCATAENGESFVLAEQNSFARAVSAPIIVAYAWAEVGQACGEEAFSESEIAGQIADGDGGNVATTDSNAVVTGNGTAEAGGDAGAGSREVNALDAKIENTKKCTGSQGVCCRTDDDICHCTLSSRESAYRCDATKEVGTSKTLWTETNVDAKSGAFECWCDN